MYNVSTNFQPMSVLLALDEIFLIFAENVLNHQLTEAQGRFV